MNGHPARHWHRLADGRLQCDLCPRLCHLHPGQRGACFVRQREGDAMVLTTYGRSAGFCIDPIEKKPLNHFHPGSSVLSFGTAGCNLACKFCQNWDLSRSRDTDRLMEAAPPGAIVQAARAHGCRSIAFTYNDPVIFAEYALDVAALARAAGLATVAVTAGYLTAAARQDFFAGMDAANVDLKAFSDAFYRRLCGARLAPVLDTLIWLVHESPVWLEITTLLIPGENDSDREIDALVHWVARELGPEIPLHFTAFHPDFKLVGHRPTPPATLRRARRIAHAAGLRHVYAGNVRDRDGGRTECAGCGATLIERDGYDLLAYRLDAAGRCPACAAPLAGRFGPFAPPFGARRIPVVLSPPGAAPR